MNRYIDCDESLVEVFLDVLQERFPAYQNFSFKLVFDTKRRISAGKIVLANIETTSDKIKYFSRDNIAVNGYDYIVIVDKKAWELASLVDKKRIISHELRHVFIDEKGTPKIVGHEIEDFYAELKLNEDDPEWARKLSTIINDIYDQEKELIKASKKELNND